MNTSFGEKNKCIANQPFRESNSKFGFSIGVYLGIGGEVSLYFDFEAWSEEIMAIYDESVSYKGYYWED